MSNRTTIEITGPKDVKGRWELENLCWYFQDEVARNGGGSWAHWDGDVLRIQLKDVSRAHVQTGTTRMVEAAMQQGVILKVRKLENSTDDLPDIENGAIPWGTVLRRKLTKKLLERLPEGAMVLSNVYTAGEEAYAEIIGPSEQREVSWSRAKKAGVANRLCRLVWTKSDFDGLLPQGFLGSQAGHR